MWKRAAKPRSPSTVDVGKKKSKGESKRASKKTKQSRKKNASEQEKGIRARKLGKRAWKVHTRQKIRQASKKSTPASKKRKPASKRRRKAVDSAYDTVNKACPCHLHFASSTKSPCCILNWFLFVSSSVVARRLPWAIRINAFPWPCRRHVRMRRMMATPLILIVGLARALRKAYHKEENQWAVHTTAPPTQKGLWSMKEVFHALSKPQHLPTQKGVWSRKEVISCSK